MTRRKLAFAAVLLGISATAVVLAVGTSPGSAKSNDVFKAAWIYVGPHNDGGWSKPRKPGVIVASIGLAGFEERSTA